MKLFEAIKTMNNTRKEHEIQIAKILQGVYQYCTKYVKEGIPDEQFLSIRTAKGMLNRGDCMIVCVRNNWDRDFYYKIFMGGKIKVVYQDTPEWLSGNFLSFDKNGDFSRRDSVKGGVKILGNLIDGIEGLDA